MPRSRYRIFQDVQPYFLTCTIVGWLPVFTRPQCVQIVYDSWGFLQEHGRLDIYGYVILENHLHLIASAVDLSEQIGDFKSYTARQILDRLDHDRDRTILRQLKSEKSKHKVDRPYQFWHEGSHPKLIEDDQTMRQKLEYMHRNPVERGYVDDPVHWRYSSARNYDGQAGLLPVIKDWA